MPSNNPHKYPFVLVAFLFFILTLLCHGLALKAQYMIDDHQYLEKAENHILNLESLGKIFTQSQDHHYSPLDPLLNILLFKTFPKPVFLYGVNLILFYVNALLLFCFVRRLTCEDHTALLATLFFIIHPVNAEILSHIASINTVLMASLLLLGSLLIFAKAVEFYKMHLPYYVLSLIFYIISLFLIETSLLFPAFLVFSCRFLQKWPWSKIILRTQPFWVISFAYFGIWCMLAGPAGGWSDKAAYLHITFKSYLSTLLSLFGWYLGNLMIPDHFVLIKNIRFLHNYSLAVLLTTIFSGLSFIIVLLCLWKNTLKNLALMWFLTGFAFLLPASLVHAYSMGMVIEPHWFFFSSMGFFILLALLCRDLKELINPLIYFTLIISFTFYWGISSIKHHLIARTEIGYLEYWLKNNPHNLLPSLMLGHLYSKYSELRIPADLVDDMSQQANLFLKSSQYPESRSLLSKLLQTYPTNPQRKFWQYSIGAIDIKTEQKEAAKEFLFSFHRQDFKVANIVILCKILNDIQLQKDALDILEQALIQFPNNPNLIYLKAVILANLNRIQEAKSLLYQRTEQPLSDLLKEITDLTH